MLQLLLLLHVLGAIIVFGPTFAFPIISRQAQKQPQHGHFAAVIIDLVERRIVIPGAILQGITGVGLILVLNADLTSKAYRWLVAAIILYAITITYAIAVQAPAAKRMVELTEGGPPAGGPPPEGAPAGPPPEIAATGQKLQRGGMFMTVMILLIVTLMVTKPGF